MAPLNRAGAGSVDLTTRIRPAEPETVRRLLAGGSAVVDLRPAAAFADAHLAGTISINLGTQLATYVGWLTPWGRPLAVLAESREEIEEARRQLVRIGVDDLVPAWGPVTGLVPGAPLSSYRRATFADLATERTESDVVLDVRRTEEYDADHVRGARHLPVPEVRDRLAEVPTDRRVWVYCAGGFRAGTAASLIERHVAEVVHVDDGFDRAVALGLTGSP